MQKNYGNHPFVRNKKSWDDPIEEIIAIGISVEIAPGETKRKKPTKAFMYLM